MSEILIISKNSALSRYFNFRKFDANYVTNEEFLDQNLNDVLYKFVFNFVKSTLQKEIKKFDLKSSWAVCQFESDYNPIHWHDGHLSGVMYTKMPTDLGSSYKDQNNNGLPDYISFQCSNEECEKTFNAPLDLNPTFFFTNK